MVEIELADAEASETLLSAVRTAVETAVRTEGRTGDVSVLITSGERIRALNAAFRDKDAVTDVLSFPASEGVLFDTNDSGFFGDIAICSDRALEQAEAYGHSAEREFAFLAAHGALHLMGYDHMNPAEEAVMLRRQKEIMKEMGLER